MKLLLPLAASLTLITNLLAQGTINFANGGAGVNAPIYAFSSSTLASTANGPWLAMLYAGPAGSTEAALSSTIVSGSPTALGGTAGYVFGGARTIAGIAPGSLATLQIRAWRSDHGATWEDAWNNPIIIGPEGGYIFGGKSAPITVTLGGGPSPTPNMVGLTSFVITDIIVPEPSLCLLTLSAFACALWLRRNR